MIDYNKMVCLICNKSFETFKQLKLHIMRKKDDKHQLEYNKLVNKIYPEFFSNNGLEQISLNINISKEIIKSVWRDNFGRWQMNYREERLDRSKKEVDIFECPVCGVKDIFNKIGAHIMNSSKEEKHNKYIVEQDKKIIEIYKELSVYDFSYDFLRKYNLFCSPTHIRFLCRNFPDYKDKISKKRRDNIKNQYKNGYRKKLTQFAGGMKFTRENGGKKYISKERYDKLIKLFSSDLNQKEICDIINCRQGTMKKVWEENFSNLQIKNRLNKLFRPLKPSENDENTILDLFNSDLTNRDIAKKIGTSNCYIKEIFLKRYSLKEYQSRCNRMRKIGIIKSLKITGTKGIIGSKAENYCYELLKEKLGNIVKHHDMDNAEPYEIDISIPSKKIAISWDGPFHNKPIFGQKKLLRVQNRDKKKQKILESKGWDFIVIKDNTNHYNPRFVEEKVNEILGAI